MGYFKERFGNVPEVRELIEKYGEINIDHAEVKAMKFTKQSMRSPEGIKEMMSFFLSHINKKLIEEFSEYNPEHVAMYILYSFDDLVRIAYTLLQSSDKIKKVFRTWNSAVRDIVNELTIINNANLFNVELYRYLVYDNPSVLRWITELTAYMRMYLLQYEYGDVDRYYKKLKELYKDIGT